MNNSNGGISRIGLSHQQIGYRFADNVAAANYNYMFTGCFNFVSLYQLKDACWGS